MQPKYLIIIVILSLVFTICAANAHAYLGPGAGLGMIGSLIAVIIAMIVIIFGLVIYPIRRFLKRKKSKVVEVK